MKNSISKQAGLDGEEALDRRTLGRLLRVGFLRDLILLGPGSSSSSSSPYSPLIF